MNNKNFARIFLKTASILLCFVLAIATLASCTGEDGTGDSGAAEKKGYSITVEGTSISPDMDMAVALQALGSMYDSSESAACPPFEGVEKLYDFVHLQISTYADGDTDRIMSIFLKDDSVDVSGVKIGSTFEEMKTALGESYTVTGTDTYVYTAPNGSTLRIIVQSNAVRAIRIVTAKAE